MGIPLDNIAIVLSNDLIFELDCPTIEPNPNLHSDFDLTIGESSDIGINDFFYSTIEMQVGVPYESNIFYRPLDSLNDEFVPIEFIILLGEFDLTVCRSSVFGVDESLLVDSPKVMYTVEDPMVDDTHVQVTIHRSISYDRGIVSSIQDFELDSLFLRDYALRKLFFFLELTKP